MGWTLAASGQPLMVGTRLMADDARLSASLDAQTAMGPVALTVSDLDGMVGFYERLLGLTRLATEGQAVALGTAEGRPLITLVRDAAAPRPGRRAPGLYHTAFLLPTRADLGRWLRHTAEIGIRLQGAADHLVSEATYLADPEGNGIEVYRDRPRLEWPMRNGRIHMDNSPFDLRGVVADGDAAGGRYGAAPAGTTVGHVHLKVADVAAARRFYVETLGFDATEEGYPGALFVAAGGYHHHLGLNTWESAGGSRAAGSLGLRSVTVTLPGPACSALRSRLADAGIALDGDDDRFAVADPFGTVLVFVDPSLDGAAALAAARP